MNYNIQHLQHQLKIKSASIDLFLYFKWPFIQSLLWSAVWHTCRYSINGYSCWFTILVHFIYIYLYFLVASNNRLNNHISKCVVSYKPLPFLERAHIGSVSVRRSILAWKGTVGSADFGAQGVNVHPSTAVKAQLCFTHERGRAHGLNRISEVKSSWSLWFSPSSISSPLCRLHILCMVPPTYLSNLGASLLDVCAVSFLLCPCLHLQHTEARWEDCAYLSTAPCWEDVHLAALYSITFIKKILYRILFFLLFKVQ